MNLKEAQEKGKIKEFIKEHDRDARGDKGKFNKTLKSISSRIPKEAQETSSQDSS